MKPLSIPIASPVHTKCAPEFCECERGYVYDWVDTDSDTTIYKHKCRDCGDTWNEEVIGSLIRAEGEMEDAG